MLEFKDNPRELMQALDRFLSVYFGDCQVENQLALDEIASWNIPEPLKDLYSFIGKYSVRGIAFGKQDSLMIYSKKISCTEKPYIQNFYTIEDAILICDRSCATNHSNAARLITSVRARFK